MSETTPSPVRTLLINPIGKSESISSDPPTISPVNYYFFVFDLPLSSGNLIFSEPKVDNEANTITYEFSYQGVEPEENAPMASYMRSFYSQQSPSMDNYEVNIVEVETSGTKKTRSKGKILKPVTTKLFDEDELDEGPILPGEDQIRYKVVLSTSTTYMQNYFLIIMSKTKSVDYINRMSLEPGNPLGTVSCFYEPRPSTSSGIESDYVAAAAFMELPCPVTNPPSYPVINQINAINSGQAQSVDYLNNVIEL